MTNINIILIDNPKHLLTAEDVLILSGFTIISKAAWCQDGVYQKDGITYNFAGWDGHKVKLIINN